MTVKTPVRERLLDAATRLLFVDGAASTPVTVLLKDAHASAASLYVHFGNKDGLLAAALDRRLEMWTQAWDEHWDATSDPAARLLSPFTAAQELRDRLPEERWCAFRATTVCFPEAAPEVAAVLTRERGLLRSRLQQAAGALLPADPEAAAALARSIEVTYEGSLALMLDGTADDALRAGHEAARSLVRAASPA